MASKVEYEEVSKPPLKKHDIKSLDLAFVMDATGSMGSYIESAKNNIRKIVEEIVASEKGDVRLALVNYRDHPPQDTSYVTQVHDFTSSPGTMKGWLESTTAEGGGDTPEAVADALHDALKLSWRDEATKICVCISDAPPHGIGASGDGFPEGFPNGIDPIEVVHQMAEKGITLYVVACEPSITPYKNFFMAIAFTTGGQYVPLTKAQVLCQVIVGGAQEEMSLERLMEEVNEEVQAEMAAGSAIDETEMTRRVHSKMMSKGVTSKQLLRNKEELSNVADNEEVRNLSKLTNLCDMRAAFKPSEEAFSFGGFPAAYGAPMPAMCTMPRYAADGIPEIAALSLGPPGGGGGGFGDINSAPGGGGGGFGDINSAPEEMYEVEEMPISVAQASRMVQKSMARNKVNRPLEK
ncbi:uncharacterized protein LOC127871799 [Dreissena polymorpha]|uniref:VWFA domain-containing protein n=1 Tax=Dreissena polymorpha TaxID=45954 RepID=A0A9D4LI89_DREPO|nr:uncharacterized protein LOC127871799 [Dreissena polymorpha]KAH3859160.1 hypothetical protein DPMN_101876 [Dreissena polymorpha]